MADAQAPTRDDLLSWLDDRCWNDVVHARVVVRCGDSAFATLSGAGVPHHWGRSGPEGEDEDHFYLDLVAREPEDFRGHVQAGLNLSAVPADAEVRFDEGLKSAWVRLGGDAANSVELWIGAVEDRPWP